MYIFYKRRKEKYATFTCTNSEARMKKDMDKIIKKLDEAFIKMKKQLGYFLLRVVESAIGCFLALIVLSMIIK